MIQIAYDSWNLTNVEILGDALMQLMQAFESQTRIFQELEPKMLKLLKYLRKILLIQV